MTANNTHDENVRFESHEQNDNTVEDMQQVRYPAPADFNTITETKSLEAALEELGPIENAPLPSLHTATTIDVEQQRRNDNDDDEFGDFKAPEVPATTGLKKRLLQMHLVASIRMRPSYGAAVVCS